ncbi:MAG: zinc transporter ZntB [Gammaproteobacteria bacterium]|nr:zinc transporter ZntB [Gammaproteobacteria bacterium]
MSSDFPYLEPVDGLVYALILNGQGGSRQIGWDELKAWRPEQGPLWAHVDRSHPKVQAWLYEESGLDSINAGALLREDTRPRAEFGSGESLLLMMRGLNFNEGDDPTDLVSLRAWVEPGRLITLRKRHVLAAKDCREALSKGKGARSIPELLRRIAERINYRFESAIDAVDNELADLEILADARRKQFPEQKLSGIRRDAVELRRYLAPQRDMFAHLRGMSPPWLFGKHKDAWRELSNIATHYVEELDNIRERAAILQDQRAARLSQAMNRTIYAMTLMTGLFLPLTFITGLLGINVGGIPGADSPLGFHIVSGVLLVLAVGQLLVFRRLRWL